MTEYTSNNPRFEELIKYVGHEGVGLDGFSIPKNKNLEKLFPTINEKKDKYQKIYNELDEITLDEAISQAKEFYKTHFSLHNINYVEQDKLLNFQDENITPYEAYESINKILESIEPFSIPIETHENANYSGNIVKPLIIYPNGYSEPNRKIYFSKMNLLKPINLTSPATIIHEMAHLQQESNIGYAKDYLNRELISLFIERIAAQELDKSGELLNIIENKLAFNLETLYIQIDYNSFLGKKPNVDDLLYYKSLLYSIKLFDNYCKERKQKDKDKYISDIQDIFDGKITVEDFIKKRNITINQCMDLSLLGRHI